MIHFNNYAYSKKYREQAAQVAEAPTPVNDKSKKLSIDNKKRRRQFEERQKVHERQEQRRREDALSTRRRRQQEATNAYKAALNKELNKRSKPRSINSTPSLGASHTNSGAATRRQIYRTPTVDEVLSNIRGHSVGGPLRTYGESTSKNVVSFTSKENNTNATRETQRDTSRDQRDTSRDSSTRHKETRPDSSSTYREIREQARGDSFRDLRNDTFGSRGDSRESSQTITSSRDNSYQNANDSLKREEGPAMVASAVYSKQYSDEEQPRLDDSLETEDLMELVRAQERAERDIAERNNKVSEERDDVEPHSSVERGEDRISVQIDLTKFDQIDVSDCESDDPPIDPTMYVQPSVKTSPILLQSDQIRSRASNYFGPPSFSNGSPFRSAGAPLRVSYSAPNVGAAVSPPAEVMQKSVSSVGLCGEEEACNFTIHAAEGDSHIYATNPVEAVKEAARTSNAWGSNSSVTTECTDTTSNKQLKSLIKRTNSGKKKQVRWDSVKALDDETMEIDQFDISSEGEAVFTRAFSHPPRSNSSLMFKDYYDEDHVNLQRTPTDAEINALWNKVRTTLHRNQAWDTPQHKTNLPQRMRSAPVRGRPEPPKSDALKIYSNILVEKDSRYKFNKKPTPSAHGPSTHKDSTENGHSMLSMEEQRILQSLERLDTRLKDTGFDGEQKNILSYQSPVLDVGTSRTPPKSETYKRLLNRNKTNGISPKFR